MNSFAVQLISLVVQLISPVQLLSLVMSQGRKNMRASVDGLNFGDRGAHRPGWAVDRKR